MADELSPSEVARRIGTTTRSVQRWIVGGQLPARRVGGRWRVASDAFDAFVRAGMTPGGLPEPIPAPSRTIHRLFIANRGEIARRIGRTADRLGIATVEPSTEGPNALDLLDIGAVVGAALAARSDALHPGFGFLAENADFAEAVEAAGIAWVGPSPAAIRAMGDKAAARRLATELGVPVVPGYDGDDQSDDALAGEAARIGFPVLVKPAAGGGGKGMRVVRDPALLLDAMRSARREAQSAFGDDRLVLERLIEGPRHVEVQVLFDGEGRGVHLGERDCSTQRRNQKVLEETPSPAVTPMIRSQLTSHALRLAGAVGYRSAGTCEFLLGDRGEIFFLEMNTRLQVEHPVTEAVTRLDLIELQLAIAEGRPIGIDQPEIDARLSSGGHAVEVRLYAEDAEDGFLPATGRVERLRWPSGPGIRVDAGIDEGTVVGSRFDPMLAKIVAHGADRAEAFDRLDRALDETLVLGLTTNLRFLRWLVREPVTRHGQMRIDTLGRVWPPDDWATRATVPDTAWQAAARAFAAAVPGSGWRLNGPPRMRIVAEGEVERSVAIDARAAAVGSAKVVREGDTTFVDVAGRSIPFRLAPAPDVDRAARHAAHAHGGGPVELVAPMPGSIVAVRAGPGQEVDAGDAIVVLDAMKMEHAVAAPIPGAVVEVRVRPGDQVARGDVLAVVEP